MSEKLENIENEFEFPKCWNDDIRMDALFAPFRVKSVNPENYIAKLNFWKDLTVKYCVFKGSSDFTLKEIRRAFRRKNKTPYGLETVIDEMSMNKEIRFKGDFLNDPINSWTTWTINSFIKKPFSWGVQKLLQATIATDLQEQNYIILELAKDQAEGLIKLLEEYEGKVLPFDELNSVKKNNLNREGLIISLTYLNYFKRIYLEYKIEENEKKISLVKVPSKNRTATSITDLDRSLYTLQLTETNLIKELDSLDIELNKNEDLARKYLREGKRSLAKSCLRKKHLLQKNTEKRNTALDNIQTLLARVHNTQTDEEVLDAYKIGSKTLKSLFADTNINLENVDEVMDDIKEAFDIHDEVQQSITNLQINTDNTEDSVLEEELMQLLSSPKVDEDQIKTPPAANIPKDAKQIDNTLIQQIEKLDLIDISIIDSSVDVNKLSEEV